MKCYVCGQKRGPKYLGYIPELMFYYCKDKKGCRDEATEFIKVMSGKK